MAGGRTGSSIGGAGCGSGPTGGVTGLVIIDGGAGGGACICAKYSGLRSVGVTGSGIITAMERLLPNVVGLLNTVNIAFETVGGTPVSYVPSAINNQFFPFNGAMVL